MLGRAELVSIPERKREELAGEVTRELQVLQVVRNAASIAIRTWVRNNNKTKARTGGGAREEHIGWIGRMFTAWRVSHAERREEREAAGEDDAEETNRLDPPPAVPGQACIGRTKWPRGAAPATLSSARAVGNSLAGLGPSRAAASCAMRVPSAAQPCPCPSPSDSAAGPLWRPGTTA